MGIVRVFGHHARYGRAVRQVRDTVRVITGEWDRRVRVFLYFLIKIVSGMRAGDG